MKSLTILILMGVLSVAQANSTGPEEMYISAGKIFSESFSVNIDDILEGTTDYKGTCTGYNSYTGKFFYFSSKETNFSLQRVVIEDLILGHTYSVAKAFGVTVGKAHGEQLGVDKNGDLGWSWFNSSNRSVSFSLRRYKGNKEFWITRYEDSQGVIRKVSYCYFLGL